MRILLTGGSGFIGTNLTAYLFDRHPEYTILNLSRAREGTRASHLSRFAAMPNYVQVNGVIEDEPSLERAFGLGADVVVHLAGRTHVDQSLRSPGDLIVSNVVATQKVLDMCRKHRVKRVVLISTAEVYGAAQGDGPLDESAPLSPANPYGASKAACEMAAFAYREAFGMDTIITRCTNNYGPFQAPDKLVPLAITNALRNRPIPMYGGGEQRRDWLHVADHCAAIDAVIHKGVPGSVYNVAGDQTATTKEIVQSVLHYFDRPWSLVEFVPDRPGNNDRLPLSNGKITRDTGWKPGTSLRDGIRETAAWYASHIEWWTPGAEIAMNR